MSRPGRHGQTVQEAGSISAEASISVSNKVQRRRLDLAGQSRSLFDQLLERLPAAARLDRSRQTRFVVTGGKDSRTDTREGFQRIADGASPLAQTLFSPALASPIELADDPVMGLDDGICDHRSPLDHTHGKDCQLAIFRQLTEPVSVVLLALAAKPSHAVGRNPLRNARVDIQLTKYVETVEHPVHVSGAGAGLELPQPDEAGEVIVNSRPQKGKKPGLSALVADLRSAQCRSRVGASSGKRKRDWRWRSVR